MKNSTVKTAAASVEAPVIERVFYKNDKEVEILSEIGKGVAKSWNNNKIAERRKARGGVSVETVENGKAKGEVEYFTSLLKAFKAKNLRESEHIPFRIKLKIDGSRNYKVSDKVTLKFLSLDSETVREKLEAKTNPAPAPAPEKKTK